MDLRAAAIMCIAIAAVGCQTVTVNVPPEVDLTAVHTVAIDAVDLLVDPAPVAVLLRVEAGSRVRRLLPSLVIVQQADQADALLRLEVASHGVTPPAFNIVTNVSTGKTSCVAYQNAFLTVGASVATRPERVVIWQDVLDARRRLELDCLPPRAIGAHRTPAVFDRYLVEDIIDNLGRRLAGYTRTELQPRQAPPPATP